MNWINIQTTILDSEEFVGSDPVARATWLCLFRYCAGQENGGVIEACKGWSDRKWQQLARVTQAEVLAESALWKWEGENLRLWAYPTDKETEVQHRRDRARTNGKLGGRPTSKPTLVSDAEPTLVRFAKAEGEGEGEGEGERKEKEKKTSAEVSAPATDAEWIETLKRNEAYHGINIEAEQAKMRTWCEVNKRQPSRRRFVNWLNRIEKPMQVQPREMYGNDYFKRRDEIEAEKERQYQERLAREKAAHEASLAGAAQVCADLLEDDPS